jgi:hypothetical protein
MKHKCEQCGCDLDNYFPFRFCGESCQKEWYAERDEARYQQCNDDDMTKEDA